MKALVQLFVHYEKSFEYLEKNLLKYFILVLTIEEKLRNEKNESNSKTGEKKFYNLKSKK